LGGGEVEGKAICGGGMVVEKVRVKVKVVK
jgi:hypothetical protein